MFGVKELRAEFHVHLKSIGAALLEGHTRESIINKRLDAVERGLHLKAAALGTEYVLQEHAKRLDKLESGSTFSMFDLYGKDAFDDSASVDKLFEDAQTKAQAKKKKKPAPKKKPKRK